ncbi:MAG: hypothetical protein JXN65_00050 [Clostridia bacterium]|nr:hypothetical protein [Clostridia bacterium]
MNRENNQNIKPTSMFLCSLLPGCAHMYMGLMKRGIQLLLAFLFLIGIAATIYGLEFILVPVIVVLYVYSFFDGYSIYRNIKSGQVVEDEAFVETFDSVKKIFANGYWIGVVLIVFGAVVFIANLFDKFAFNIIDRYYLDIIVDFFPAAFLLIAGTVLMVIGNKQRKKLKEDRER